ncbi:hypothetical protein [Spirillospora sp. CA-294931]|uniref:hypothetical protein n=1 Tax=Spirillospora sp. CA-294931 TaxID=3240042 RepID=UPI003D8FEE3F
MTNEADEPLEGDIGPAASRRAENTTRPDAAAELAYYERERELRRKRNNAVSGRITAILVAVFLAFLAVDSVMVALRARSAGDPWLYPPATVAAISLLALAALGVWALRRRSR